MQIEDTYLDEKHVKTVEAVKKTGGNIKKAAEALGIERQDIYNHFSGVRRVRKKARTSVNMINNWMRDPVLRKYIY